MNLKQKLIEIRKAIGVLQKTEQGNQGARYVDPAVILLKIRESMDKFNVLLSCEVIESSVTQIPAPTNNNPNNMGFFSNSKMLYTWHDVDSDETVLCDWYATGKHMQDPSMAFGGSLTYSERYFMLKFFQVPTTKDDPEFLKNKAGVIEYITDEQQANIMALIQETNTDINQFLQIGGIGSLSEMVQDDYNGAIGILEAKRGR